MAIDYYAVTLFSAGLDSLACLHWMLTAFPGVPTLSLYFDTHTHYTAWEMRQRAFINDCYVRGGYSLSEETIDLNFVTEKALGHIPLRNVFFLELASLRAGNIVFGMLKGEQSEDKNPKFIRQMQRLLHDQNKENLYNTGRKIEIMTPFAHMTKTGCVRWMLNHGVSRALIASTVGCLHPDEHRSVTDDVCSSYYTHCGYCISCFNRWIALQNNDLIDSPAMSVWASRCALWGMQQWHFRNQAETDNEKRVQKAVKYGGIWRKREWIIDAYHAYKSAEKMGLIKSSQWSIL